jgi:hypothetical protein
MFVDMEIEQPLKSGAIAWSERLKEALAGAAAEDVSELDDRGLRQGFASLQQAAEMIAAQRLRRLAEVDRRRSFAPDGHLSTTSWLVGEFGIAGGEAAGAVKMARALEQMPKTRQALAAGELSTSAVPVLVSANDAAPEAFAKDEGLLLETAREHTVEGLSRVVGSWRQRVDADEALRAWRRLRETRHLSVSRRSSGMVHIDGELDPETGERVVTALDAVIDADVRSGIGPDGRTRPQRRWMPQGRSARLSSIGPTDLRWAASDPTSR